MTTGSQIILPQTESKMAEVSLQVCYASDAQLTLNLFAICRVYECASWSCCLPVREVNNNLLGGQFLIFLPKIPGWQLSILTTQNPNGLFSLETVRARIFGTLLREMLPCKFSAVIAIALATIV